MNERLYRGISKMDGSWAYGAYSYHRVLERGFIVNVAVDMHGPIAHTVEVDPDTVGQFTGLYDATTWEELTPEERKIYKKKDWKGRMIFEGDILEAHYDERFPENATRTVVIWSEIGYQDHKIGWYMKQDRYLPDPLELADAERNKVIGNVHQHRHLLEEAWL